MSSLNLTQLAVGDRVSVAYRFSWNTRSQGVYTVVKANKMVIELARESDGYLRKFSVKRGEEMGVNSARSYIESIADMEQREAQLAAERAVRDTWVAAEKAAQKKDLTALRAIVDQLAALAV